jgi:hypothetical protein
MAKEILKTSIPEGESVDYLINDSKGTAIKIPKGVLNTIQTKLRSNDAHLEESVIAADIIAVAIQNKAAYQNKLAFIKFLKTTLVSRVTSKLFTNKEMDDLIQFFAEVPSGYVFNEGNRIWFHTEIEHTLKF